MKTRRTAGASPTRVSTRLPHRVIELPRLRMRNALMDDQRHLFPVHRRNGQAAARIHTTMLPAVHRHIVGRFARLSLYEKNSAECESPFAVIDTNDAALEGAIVLMKLAALEVRRPVSRKIWALLRGNQDAGRSSDDERPEKGGMATTKSQARWGVPV